VPVPVLVLVLVLVPALELEPVRALVPEPELVLVQALELRKRQKDHPPVLPPQPMPISLLSSFSTPNIFITMTPYYISTAEIYHPPLQYLYIFVLLLSAMADMIIYSR
jgi:hypothetical protein